MRCDWCSTNDHAMQECPSLAATRTASAHGIIDPMTVEDVNDAVALRMIAWRTYAGQLERELREAGVSVSAATQSLKPDRQFEDAV